MTATIDTQPVESAPRSSFLHSARFRILAITLIGIGVVSTARIIADNPDLTSSGTFGVGLRTVVARRQQIVARHLRRHQVPS